MEDFGGVMKVLLITINNREHLGTKDVIFVDPPLNLMYLAQSLLESGHEAKVLDSYAFDLSTVDLLRTIKRYNPDMIAVSLYSWDLDISFRITKKIKEVFPHIKLVFGGHHASYLPEKTMEEFYFLDFLIRGEAEITIVELAEALEKGKDLSKIKGLTYRSGKKIIHTPERPVIADLDTIPIPNPRLVKTKLYYSKLSKTNPLGVVITSRGCPYRCTFCSRLNEQFRKYRQRSAENVFQEIKQINDTGAKSLDIYDETFTINHKRCVEILRLMKEEGINLDIRVRTRVNIVNKELLQLFSKNNVKMVCYGVESGNQQILDNINKMITLPKIEKALKLTHRMGLETSAFYIIGLPGDTPKTIRDTINFAKKLDSTFPSFASLYPLPNTKIYAEASKWGELIGEWSVYKSAPYLRLPWMKSKEDLMNYLKLAYDEVIKNPRFITKAFLRCIKTRNWNNLSYMAKNAFKDLRKIKGFRIDEELRIENESK